MVSIEVRGLGLSVGIFVMVFIRGERLFWLGGMVMGFLVLRSRCRFGR